MRLHRIGFVHRDLKLENIVIGHKNTKQAYLIDFGLATRFEDPKTNRHLRQRQINRFQGNIMFASRSQCLGLTLSRRDDMESAFSILIFLLHGRLPWYN
jgi:serine/threonine protein kinase